MERPDLAPYAARSSESLGRTYPEMLKDDRPAFERDRDRIIHCAAFRLLEYKTQVFVNHEGDYYRTRLTHSLEVAQIARGTARRLQLNEDLVEALALAHDVGHTPFGHTGEETLNRLMAGHGGFEHNLAMRVAYQRRGHLEPPRSDDAGVSRDRRADVTEPKQTDATRASGAESRRVAPRVIECVNGNAVVSDRHTDPRCLAAGPGMRAGHKRAG